MGETRHGVLPAKGLIEQHMQGGTGQPFLTTYHMRNLHEMVINDIGEMIGGQLVSTLIKHLIVEDITHDAHITANKVIDMNSNAWRNLKTHNILMALGNEAIHLLLL